MRRAVFLAAQALASAASGTTLEVKSPSRHRPDDNLTEDQAAALALDASTLKRGRELATPAKWGQPEMHRYRRLGRVRQRRHQALPHGHSPDRAGV